MGVHLQFTRELEITVDLEWELWGSGGAQDSIHTDEHAAEDTTLNEAHGTVNDEPFLGNEEERIRGRHGGTMCHLEILQVERRVLFVHVFPRGKSEDMITGKGDTGIHFPRKDGNADIAPQQHVAAESVLNCGVNGLEVRGADDTFETSPKGQHGTAVEQDIAIHFDMHRNYHEGSAQMR